jgi:uncharacterized cupin superfamily protein
MKIFNLHGDHWDEPRKREGWRIKEAFVGHHIGGELIGASISEVEPGNKLWPYHTHYANEEWAIVLAGEPALRTPEGEQVLKEGDVVCFSRGEKGAHQIINRTESPIRVLMLSSMVAPDIVHYPDTEKVSASSAEANRSCWPDAGRPSNTGRARSSPCPADRGRGARCSMRR